jgi:hypothetical protein
MASMNTVVLKREGATPWYRIRVRDGQRKVDQSKQVCSLPVSIHQKAVSEEEAQISQEWIKRETS